MDEVVNLDFIETVEENWLSQRPDENAFPSALLLLALVFGISFGVFSGWPSAGDFLSATPIAVFQDHQFWRAWTTLFVHGDLGHLLSNAFFLLPLTFLLAGYFGPVLMPVLAITMGGVTNLLVLKTLPEQVTLIGISGVVYWMGSAWLTLYILISRKVRFRRRFAYALFLTLMLFVPDTYKPEVSYLSHFVGFVLGIASAIVLYHFRSQKFLSAEKTMDLYAALRVPTETSTFEEVPRANPFLTAVRG